MLIATFRLLTASLLQAMGSTGSGTALCMAVVRCDWRVSIRYGVFVRRPLTCRSPLVFMFFYCRHPRFRYFGSVVPIDVVRVKSYVNSLFHFSRVPVVVSINKLYFFPQLLMSRFVSVFLRRRNSGCVRNVYLCRVLSFFPAWVALFHRCRLFRIRMVSCRLRCLVYLGQRDLKVGLEDGAYSMLL